MYVPILKHRLVEKNVINNYIPQSSLSENIIPLVELAEEKFGDVVKLVNGLPEKESYINDNGRKCWRQKRYNTDTIPYKLNKSMSDRKIMIDYLRLSPREYNGMKSKLFTFCTRLDTNYGFYISKLKNLTNYSNIIPVISIKRDTRLTVVELENALDSIHDFQKCLRVQVSEISKSLSMIAKLNERDILLIDFKESSNFRAVDYSYLRTICKSKIIISSVNRLNTSNGEFPNLDYTTLISNEHIRFVNENGLDGFSDYAGLKDNYVTSSGGNGTGCTLALFLDSNNIKYYSYCNYDVSLGMKGYKEVSEAIKSSSFYHSNTDCDSFKEVDRILSGGKYGNWSSWNKVTLISTLYQISKII